MTDHERRGGDQEGAGVGHAVIGLASALALLVDRLEANGSLPAGDFQTFLHDTLSHPSVDRAAPDAAVLETLLDLLGGVRQRTALRLVKGGSEGV